MTRGHQQDKERTVEDRRRCRGLRRRSSGSQEDVVEEERLSRPGEEVAYSQPFPHSLRRPLALSHSALPTTSLMLIVHLDAKLKVD